jgi:hypothetical protein
MTFAAFWAFISLLCAQPTAQLTPQFIDKLWAQAQAHPVAVATTIPSFVTAPPPASPPSLRLALNPGNADPVEVEPTVAPAPIVKWTAQPLLPVTISSSAPVLIAKGGTQAAPWPAAGLPYVFSGAFSNAQGNQNPLFTPLASLQKTQLSAAVVNTFWGFGLATGDSPLDANGPVYVVGPFINRNAPELTFTTHMFGSGNAVVGTKIHVPQFAVNQMGTKQFIQGDSHISIIDYLNQVIVEGWQCANDSTWNGQAFPGQLACSWGARFAIGGNGLPSDDRGDDAQHSGLAIAAVDLTPQEILNAEAGTPIAHALQIGTRCLNNPSIYPADTVVGSDTLCNNETPGNYPQSGDYLQLIQRPSLSIASHSAACQAVLQVMQTYGAVIGDTGENSRLLSLSDFVYSTDSAHGEDAWAQVIPQMAAFGEASMQRDSPSFGSGSGALSHRATWSSCLSGYRATDFNMWQVAKP